MLWIDNDKTLAEFIDDWISLESLGVWLALFSGLHLKLGKGGIKFCVVRSEGVL
jgi:hypothetical protein